MYTKQKIYHLKIDSLERVRERELFKCEVIYMEPTMNIKFESFNMLDKT